MEKISIKQKLLDTISAHPKLMIYGVSLAITFAVSLVVEIGRASCRERV